MSGPPPYPPRLCSIIELFESLPDEAKRENLIAYSDQAGGCEPGDGECFDLEDVRKDEECADTVGIFLRRIPEGGCHIRIRLGPHVQTLTRAMAAILCKGLEGETPARILELPADFVPRIVGAELVRVRSQTTYYVLGRIKNACRTLLQRALAGGN
jgi:cysteine desulfuration protein SufE